MKNIFKTIVLALLTLSFVGGIGYGIYKIVKSEIDLRNQVKTMRFLEIQTRDFIAYAFPDQVAQYNAKVAELEAQAPKK